MRIVLTLFLFCVCMSVKAQQQYMTEMKKAIDLMQEMYDITFVYDSSLVTTKPQSFPLAGNSLKENLERIFGGIGIKWEIRDEYVLLFRPNNYTFSGYVCEDSGETLINVTILDLNTLKGTLSNAHGFFSITLPEGKHKLRFSYIGYQDVVKEVDLTSNYNGVIYLKESNTSLKEVVVVADLNAPLRTTQTGKVSLTSEQLNTEFSLLSSPDLVKTLQNIPGVASGTELLSGMYVHGGKNDENLFLLDGTPLYQINHLGGLFSAFNTDIIKNVDVIIYAVEKSLDSYKFNLLHCKQTFISQLKSGAMGARTIDEGAMDEKSGMNFSEYMALLSGNTDLLDKAKLEKRIASLEGERKSFNKGKRDSEFKLESKTGELRNNTAFIDAMTEDWNRFLSVVQTDKEGNRLNIIKVDGVDSADEKVIGKRLQEIAKNATTGGLYTQVGELYGFPIKVVSERILKEGLEFTDNRFVVEGNYKYTYNNGHLAMADPLAAARNFLNAMERIPSIIDQYKAKNEVLEMEIPQLQEIAGKVWKKEDELKQLKSELAALDRKIQLELAPPTPEVAEKENEGQQLKPEAEDVRNRQAQYPENAPPQIRSPADSIVANHVIIGRPGLYAKEETRSKGLKI